MSFDLFIPDHALTPDEKRKLFGAKRKSPIPSGHYMPKGTGPAGETCKTCKHIVRKRMGKTYLKCNLARGIWTGGSKSDIRANDAACKGWEAQ